MSPLGESHLEQVSYTGYSLERVEPKFLCSVVLSSRALRSRTNLTGMAPWSKISGSWQHLPAVGARGLACLRALNASVINAANNELTSSAPVVFNPAPDGLYFRQHATLKYAEGIL